MDEAVKHLRKCHLDDTASAPMALERIFFLLQDEENLSVAVGTDLVDVLIDGIRIHIRTQSTSKYVEALAICSNHGELANEIRKRGGIGILTKRLASRDSDEVDNAARAISNCNSADGNFINTYDHHEECQ